MLGKLSNMLSKERIKNKLLVCQFLILSIIQSMASIEFVFNNTPSTSSLFEALYMERLKTQITLL